MRVVYLDTNIYLDYLLDRVGKTGNKLGDRASKVFMMAFRGEIAIAASDLNMREFSRQADVRQLNTMFLLIRNHIRIYTTDEDREEAGKLSKINFDDALHVVLAKKAGASVIITRNKDHFAPFASIMKPCLPEEFVRFFL